MFKKYKRAIAIFLLLMFVANIFAPTISWALTAGPTAPEATSFEPVDTTDMVNLSTGDLVYNLPLIEVPGPSGGYPLSLSYHAGIQTDEEATWCGLGFSLNPGAINRSISGFSDDFQNVIGSERSFWEGGDTKTFAIGVNVGLSSFASVSAGLVFSQDTYKGRGVGHYTGIGLSQGGSFGNYGVLSKSLSYTSGVSPYGDSYSSTGFSVGIGATTSATGHGGATGLLGVGISRDNNGTVSGGLSASVSYRPKDSKTSFSALDASTSTSSGSSLSFGGVSGSIHNSNSGSISTHGYNHSFEVPMPFGSITLGKSYQRYWIDETALVGTYGALYFPSNVFPSSGNNQAYDVYDLIDVRQPLSKSVPDESLAGSFIDYDNYQVLAQGLSGSMRPFHYKSYLIRQTKKEESRTRVRSYPLHGNNKAAFRFVGDFSNRFLHEMDLDKFNVSTNNATDPLAFSFNSNQTTGSGEPGDVGYIEEKNLLPGSKAIEWFTNSQIVDKGGMDSLGNSFPPSPDASILNGFIDCNAKGFSRDGDGKIGGYKITNSSGVTYHYALPVYSFDEYSYSGKLDEKNKHKFNLYKKKEKYAYTWLLTAVTGPDFVDKNQNGFADNQDFGYWVTFEYGKWTSNYAWRNPAKGFNKDLDQEFNNYSKGKKEIYYLNTITTATHTAIFVKELRRDGKGIVPEFEEAILTGGNHNVEDIDEGGFDPKIKKDFFNNNYTDYPVSVLKLSSIYLVQNKDNINISSLSSAGNIYYHSNGYSTDIGKNTYGKNIIDIYDLQTGAFNSDLASKALKKVEFHTDYSLSPGTPNSFKSGIDVLNTSEAAGTEKEGKLTLTSVEFVGRNNSRLIPPLKFDYDLNNKFNGSLSRRGQIQIPDGVRMEGIFIKVPDLNQFKIGDIIKYGDGSNALYAYVDELLSSSNELSLFPITSKGWRINNAVQNAVFYKTKNPPYNSEFFDLWGLYKSDTEKFGIFNISENVKRMTTSVSAQSVDVWSLRTITTSLGAKIKFEYEPDTYKNALKSLANIPVKSVETLPDGKTKFTLYQDLSEYGLGNQDNIKFRLVSAVKYSIAGGLDNLHFNCNGEKKYIYQWLNDENNNIALPIESAQSNEFVLNYRLKDKFPTGACIKVNPPYGFDDVTGNPNCIDTWNFIKSDPIFLGGEILSSKPFSPYGGDLRVKKVSLDDGSTVRSTLYQYYNGITTYEPLGFAVPIKRLSRAGGEIYSCLEQAENDAFNAYRDKYLKDVYGKFLYLFANSREIPGPGVFYELVKVREQIDRNGEITEFLGSSEYQFEVFSPKSIDVTNTSSASLVYQFNNPLNFRSSDERVYSGSPFGLPTTKIIEGSTTTIEDFSSIIGSLKRITLYDNAGRKITETLNQYLHDRFDKEGFKNRLSHEFKNQGTIAETFADARIVINPIAQDADPNVNRNYSIVGILSQKIKYPSIQTGQTVINYKTGIKTVTENKGFDFYSGEITKTKSYDGLGSTFIAESNPAYRNYKKMGLAANGGKNMLTQEAASYTYKIDGAGNKIGLVGASIQTWSDSVPVLSSELQIGIWRKHAGYTFVGNDYDSMTGDGLYPLNNALPPFNAWYKGSSTPARWQKNGAITLYDVHSHALEVSDVNAKFAATKMSFDNTMVFATTANARYGEFAYSGAEDGKDGSNNFGGGVYKGNSCTLETLAHTGFKSVKGSVGQKAFSVELQPQNRMYHISFWSSKNQGLIKYQVGTGAVQNAQVKLLGQAGSWYLLEADITLTDANTVVWVESSSGDTYFDDFRVHPFKAAMIGYVYNEWGELSHILDNNNLYTEFKYDGMGRLKETYKETFSHGRTLLTETKYHYANQGN